MQPPIPNHTFFQVLAHCAVCSQQVELLKFNAISTCGSPSFLLLKKTFLGKWKKQGVFITQDTNYYCVVVPESLYQKKLYFCRQSFYFIVVFVFVYFCLDGNGRFVRVYDPSYLAHIIEINLYTTLTYAKESVMNLGQGFSK